MIDREEMVRILTEEFPQIKEDITSDTWAGLVHLEIGCFARYTQEQVDTAEKHEVKRCYEVARKLMLDGDESIQNAVGVSFLEHLNLQDGKKPRSWALDLLPEPLRTAHRAIWE